MDRSTTAPTPGEAVSEERHATWVKSSLIPRNREDAPTLEQLCTTLIAALKALPLAEAITAEEKPSKQPITGPSTAISKDEPAPNSTHYIIPGTSSHLNDRLCEVCPEFTTYTQLETLYHHSEPPIAALAARIRAIFLTWMEDERVEATWVTPNILIDGMLGSLDPTTLAALCKTHSFRHVALLSIHPDDWVVGGTWVAHGLLPWTKRPASTLERAHGITERLVALDDRADVVRRPGWIVQSGTAVRSPVVDQLVVPLEDGAGASLLVHLADICTFLAAHASQPDVLVLVNCKMGFSRSNAALEAFVLQAVARRLRDDDGWTAKSSEERQADLMAVQRDYHKAFERRRPDLKDKFPRQLESWAKFLADGEPEGGPDFAMDKASAGGEGMRDAAVVACYEGNWLLPETLVAHYYKRTGTGKGRSGITISRFRDVEQQLRVGLEKSSDHGGRSWLPLNEFVDLCKSTHEGSQKDHAKGRNFGP